MIAARELRFVGQCSFLGETEVFVWSAEVDEPLCRTGERLAEGPVERGAKFGAPIKQ